MFSTTSAINATVFATGRLMRDVAKDRELPAFFSHENAQRIPVRAVMVIGGAGLALAIVGRLTQLAEAAWLAFRYKDLWMVEAIFRSMKSLLETRPIYHRGDETIRGHVFCSFLALVLRKALQDRLAEHGVTAEWADVPADLERLRRAGVAGGRCGAGADGAVREGPTGHCRQREQRSAKAITHARN